MSEQTAIQTNQPKQLSAKAPDGLKNLEALRWFLEDESSAYRHRLEQMIGRRRAQFAASLMSLANSTEKFKEVKPQSIIAAAVVAASLDLPIDRNMGFAWIIPYGKLAQFQIGYKGWIQLALRSGKYEGMNAVIVNQEMWQGWDLIGDPAIDWNAFDRTKPAIGYCFAWRLTSGFTKLVYWTKEMVQHHAERYSKAYRYGLQNPNKPNAQDSPWFTHFDEMGLKTVISNSLRRWGIMSVEYQELQTAYERDQSAAIDVDAIPIYPDADDDAEETQTEPITRPEAKRLEEPKQAAGMTVEDVKQKQFERIAEFDSLIQGRDPENRMEKVMIGRVKPRTKAEETARATFVEYMDKSVEQNKNDTEQDVVHVSKEKTEGETQRVVDDGPASPGAIQTIKVKLERAALSISDLQKVKGFESLNSLDDLKQSQVNPVLEFIRNPNQ